MKLLNGYIAVIKTDTPPEKTDTGIYIAKTEHEYDEYHVGEVKHISENKEHDAKSLKVGDKVIYKHYKNIHYNEFELIMYKDIIAII